APARPHRIPPHPARSNGSRRPDHCHFPKARKEMRRGYGKIRKNMLPLVDIERMMVAERPETLRESYGASLALAREAHFGWSPDPGRPLGLAPGRRAGVVATEPLAGRRLPPRPSPSPRPPGAPRLRLGSARLRRLRGAGTE